MAEQVCADAAAGTTRGHKPPAQLWCERRALPCDPGVSEAECRGVTVTDAKPFLREDVHRCVLYNAMPIHLSNKNK